MACGLAYAAALLVLLWCRVLEPASLLAGGIGVLATFAWLWRRLTRCGQPLRRCIRTSPGSAPLLLGALAVLAAALVAGGTAQHRLGKIATQWEVLVAERDAELHAELDRRMALLLEHGGRAARDAAARAADPGGDLFADLAGIRARSAVSAIALFNEAGEPVAWAGDHRGALPAEAKTGRRDVVYAERPLFSYLYFSQPVEGRGARVVAAVLLQTGFAPESEGVAGFAERFAQRRGARPFFAAGPGEGAAWPLVVGGDTIAHARFEPLTQGEWRARVGGAGRRVVVPLVVVALVLIAGSLLRSRRGSGNASAVSLLGLAVALAVAPVGAALGLERLFSPGLFLLPIPGEVTLGRLLVVLLPLAALTAASRPAALDRRRGWAALALGMLAVALGFAGGLRLLVAGAGPGLLQGGSFLRGAFQLAALLLLTMLAALALPQGRSRAVRPLLLLAGLALSLVLTGVVLARWRLAQSVDPWLPALWALPFALVGLGIMPYAGRASRLARWLLAGWLAATAALPYLWVTHVDARLQAAERELTTLGLRPDPFLDYLLHLFAEEAARRHARGEDGVELLYRSWVGSGLAREAYPVRMALWSVGNERAVELSLGDASALRHRAAPGEASLLTKLLENARATGRALLEPAPAALGASQILAVPLDDGSVISAIVLPRRSLERTTVLAPILGAAQHPDTRLTLVQATDTRSLGRADAHWTATDQGWRSEMLLHYPDGEYHAHVDLRVPSLGVLLARGLLLLALDLGLLALLWAIGRAARGEPPAPPGGWVAWAESFRARITAALFGFFLLPTIFFGVVAYRALAGEAARTARVVAERATVQAVAAFPELPGNWRALSARIGEEVLYYHRGELAQASSPEIVELGLFGAWMPPRVYSTLQGGEEASVVETRQLGRRSYLVAYRRLPAGTLAVPVSLAAGESAIRQRELAHLVLCAVLMGGLLSLALSVAVGRALARPIGQLRRASAAVGGGRLRVHLPESGAGEFGELFASFNRMVRRLRRARAQELRTARVLAWGEMSRQVAHEIKNPLTPIKLSVQHLRRAFADRRPDFGDILKANVEQILKEIDRLTEIARAFSRYGAPAEAAGPLQPVDVAAVVREALTLYRAGETHVHYWPELDADLPPVRARPGELKEVLLNLLENAHAALDGGGAVVVSARCDGDFVELAVSDDGPGIAPELIPRIFEPHFSTRSAGTGLGLAIVRRLVEDWGGAVSAESELRRGTTIRMRLPVAAEARQPQVAE